MKTVQLIVMVLAAIATTTLDFAIAQSQRARPTRAAQIRHADFIQTATTLMVGRKTYDVSGVKREGEQPLIFDHEMAMGEANVRQGSPLWVTFKWQSVHAGIVRAEWQLFRQPISYDMADADSPVGMIAHGAIQDLPAPRTEGYFWIDFRQFFKNAREPQRSIPASPNDRSRKIAAPGNETSQPRSSARSDSKSIMLPNANITGSLRSMLLSKNAVFAGRMKRAAQWQPLYIRIALFRTGNAPVAVSSYVRVRALPEEPVYLYPEAQSRIVAPSITYVKYVPDVYHYPEERMYNYIVLANCPPFLLQSFGWKVGQKVNLKPHKDDKEWYEQVGNAISSAIDSFAGLVNWVSKTWANLQAELVNGICFRNPECTALAGPALKYGLTCIGVPPEIPNFNQLCNMGVDYLTSYVASQTPIGDLSEDAIRAGINKLGDVVRNPPSGTGPGAAFLWPDPDFQNKPAYFTIEAYNSGTEPTDGVDLWLTYGSKWGDGSRTPPDIAPFLDTHTPIPPLAPGKRLSIPIFLTENPEIHYSHGNDNWGNYYNHPIQIFRGDTREPVFTSQSTWFAPNGAVPNDMR